VTAHPTSLELARFVDGHSDDNTRSHLQQCAYCRSLIAGASERVEIPAPSVTWESAAIDMPVPSIGMPMPGDVWRVVRDDLHQLAVVLGESDSAVVVAPILLESRDADEWTVLLDSSQSDLGFELAVAVAHRFVLPLFVFDACVGHLTEAGRAIVEAVSLDYRRGTTTTERTGPSVLSPLDDRVESIDSLAEEFVALSGASWYTPPAENDVDWTVLMDLDVDPSRVYELSKGARPTPDEIAAATAAGQLVERMPYASDLVDFLDRPRQSTRLRVLATERSTTDSQTRIEAADRLTERRMALAARGGDASFDWEPLFQEYLGEARS
jgi:hypothetical protein